MTHEPRFVSCFEQVYDVVVFGGGYAGFAAATGAARQGKRVLIADLRGDLLWESGRAYVFETGSADDPAWQGWLKELSRVDGAADGRLDGAIAETAANEALRRDNPAALYYVMPVDVEMSGHLLAAVILATKDGPRRVAARQWVDATEAGTLARLLDPDLVTRAPDRQLALLYFQQATWPGRDTVAIDAPDLAGCRLTWTPTLWSNQRCLQIEMPGTEPQFRRTFVPALKAARAALADQLRGGFVSNSSVTPFPVYAAAGASGEVDVPNVTVAVAGLAEGAVASLADRFMRGVRAAEALADAAVCDAADEVLRHRTMPRHPMMPSQPVAAPTAVPTDTADVAVIGAGTGGALAVIAAAREGVKTVAIEPLSFAGGIGTGGNIPSYYWGMAGGLQDEVDARVAEIMELFTTRDAWGGGFHPDAKMVVLDAMMAEAGADVRYGQTLAGVAGVATRPGLAEVSVENGTVGSALIAGPNGPYRLEAKAWIDATGDGDLSAWAGASFRYGRDGDYLPHAYTQSAGRLRAADESGREASRVCRAGVNYDSGFVDPTDSQDLTRARVEGIHQHVRAQYDEVSRPTFLAPQLGLREGRLLDTDYVMTLDDQLLRRRFDDSVGLTGCHFDNHAVDYEFESDDALVYVWGLSLRPYSLCCEIPYRILLPKGLDNVWIACRALGVTQDAHYSLRMQRDLQRVGEVCGIAAALACENDCGSRAIPFDRLRARLDERGALTLQSEGDEKFGRQALTAKWSDPYAEMEADERIRKCLEEMRKPEMGVHAWYVFREGPGALRDQVAPLLDADNDVVAWKAAVILAAWGDAAAEPRLLRAVRDREEGAEFAAVKEDRGQRNQLKSIPRWWLAVGLLRFCGTGAALPILADLAGSADLVLNARSTLALTCERIARRTARAPGAPRAELSSGDKHLMLQILERLVTTDSPGATGYPARDVVTGEDPRRAWGPHLPPVEDDFRWQLHYAVARARAALGLGLHPQAQDCLDDPRAQVRRAFAKVPKAGE